MPIIIFVVMPSQGVSHTAHDDRRRHCAGHLVMLTRLAPGEQYTQTHHESHENLLFDATVRAWS